MGLCSAQAVRFHHEPQSSFPFMSHGILCLTAVCIGGDFNVRVTHAVSVEDLMHVIEEWDKKKYALGARMCCESRFADDGAVLVQVYFACMCGF